MDAAAPSQVQFLQLYVNKDREVTKRIVQHAEKRGIKGLFITVDAPQLGRREKDMRQKFEAEDPSEVKQAGQSGVDRSQGAARAISVRIIPSWESDGIHIVYAKSFIDPGLNWSDMKFFKGITNSMFREFTSPWSTFISLWFSAVDFERRAMLGRRSRSLRYWVGWGCAF